MSESVRGQIEATIQKLEGLVNTQAELDNIYTEIKDIFMKEMSGLPDLPLSNNSKSNNKFRKSKPFWNDDLALLWKKPWIKASVTVVSRSICAFKKLTCARQLAKLTTWSNSALNGLEVAGLVNAASVNFKVTLKKS